MTVFEDKRPKSFASLPHEYIIVDKKNPDPKQRVIGVNQKWTIEDALLHSTSLGGKVCCSYNLKDTNFAVFDVDTDDYPYEQFCDDLHIGIKSTYWVKGNTKGYHVWVAYGKSYKKPSNKNVVNVMKNCVGDYLGEKVFERIDKEWMNTGIQMIVDKQMMGFIFDMDKINKIKPKKEKGDEDYQTSDNDILEKICDLIDVEYLDDRKEWLSIILAMKKSNLSIDFAKLISSKSDKYDEDSFDVTWESYCDDQITSTEGTLRHYAKISNEKEYMELIKKDGSGDVVMDLNKFYNLQSELVMPDELQKEMEMYSKLNKEEQALINDKKEAFDNQCFQDELKKKLKYFEEFHFKVMNPACFGRTSYNKTQLVNASEFELQYENVCVGEDDLKWTKIWRSLKYIRTFENVDFLPHPLPCPDYTLNTFNGLRAAKLPSCEPKDIDLLLNHIKILSGNDEAGSKYIIDYLAHAVQKPGELPRVALVFQSDQGTGKNIFFENFVRKMLGGEYLLQTAEMDKVIGRFSMINNKLFVIMDETSGKDSFSNSDKIKNIITAEQVAWERKGIDGININNCGRYLFFSNNETPVKIESSDRRYVVYKCSNDRQNDSVYFKEMSKMFNDDAVIKTFYNYLMNDVDISDWDSINDRPITEAYQDIQSANTPAMAKWLEERYYELNHFIEMESDDDVLQEHKVIPSKTLYLIYTEWLNGNGFKKMEYNTTKFGREIAKYDGISKKRNKSGIVYVIDYEVLKTFMIRKKYMECIVEE
tara:strand:- start:316 stop:2598 length:2283 start_codon:yes stop_codon:yes gene_type:complete